MLLQEPQVSSRHLFVPIALSDTSRLNTLTNKEIALINQQNAGKFSSFVGSCRADSFRFF